MHYQIVILSLIIALLLPGCSSAPSLTVNDHEIKIEVADDQEERVQGLSDRKTLCDDCGMLFIFPASAVQRFWMKNMHFPLDIIWINGDRVVGVSEGLAPEGERPSRNYPSPEPADKVLEVNAGKAGEWGVAPGQTIEMKP